MKITNIQKFNTKIRTIDNKLLAGNQPSYLTLKYLKTQGIDTVIDLRAKNQWPKVLVEKIKCKLLHIKHIWHPIKLIKKFPTKQEFKSLNNIIQNSNKTFVHCRSGIHCTNLVCAASSILRGQKSVEIAIEDIKKADYFLTRKPTENTDKRQKKLNKLAQRLIEFSEMFKSNPKA